MTTHPNKPIQIQKLMPGAEIISTGGHQIAVGFPEEVVKAWMKAKIQPTAWLVPDVRSASGVVQWALEFPLYYALFIQGLFAAGKKVQVVTRRSDWPALLESLRLTLLGPSQKEMIEAGVSEARAGRIARESEHLALKTPKGKVAQIEDFLEPHFFDEEGMVELDGLRMRRQGDNVYSFFSEDDRIEEHRIEHGPAAPPYAAELPRPMANPLRAQPFQVIALGTGTGFDPSGPCTSFLVQTNGRFMLIDAGPYVLELLTHAGFSPNQLEAVFITHAHEDHAVGLSSLLKLNKRLRLHMTLETATVLRRKLAILNPGVSAPEKLLDDAFNLQLIHPNEEGQFASLRLRFHDTLHPIPCVGVEMSMPDGAGRRSVLFVGDHASRQVVLQAHEAGAIDEARLAALESLHHWQGDLMLADVGGGPIHGLCSDYATRAARQLVCVHTPALPAEEAHLHTLARPGHRYTLIEQQSRPSALERGLAQQALSETFGTEAANTFGAMLDGAEALTVNRDQVVLRAGEVTRDVYVILSGELEVWVDGTDNKARRVAKLQAGEVFGEMAAIRGAPRSATVRAACPARLVRIPDELFGSFAKAAELAKRLPELWRKRSQLERVPMLAATSVTARNHFAEASVIRTIGPGSTLIREGSRSNTVFILVAGRVQVYKGEEPLLVNGAPVIVPAGQLIGETAPFLAQARNASIVTLDECQVLAIRGQDFKRIVKTSPQMFTDISRLVAERRAA